MIASLMISASLLLSPVNNASVAQSSPQVEASKNYTYNTAMGEYKRLMHLAQATCPGGSKTQCGDNCGAQFDAQQEACAVSSPGEPAYTQCVSRAIESSNFCFDICEDDCDAGT